MGSTFSRVKTWLAAQTLTAADLNAEFDNILNNFTPAGMDDESANAAAMQATADPYPGSVASLATSLTGEIQRIRYQLNQLVGGTYWYEDALGAANLKRFMNAGATAPEWAVGIKLIQTTYNLATATGTVAITGVGFKPSAVIFMSGKNSSPTVSLGLDDLTSQINVSNSHGAVATQWSINSTYSIYAIIDGSNYVEGVVNSFDADGLTIGYTKTGSPTGTLTQGILCIR